MKRSRLLWLALLAFPLAFVPRAIEYVRGVRPYQERPAVDTGPFDASQSVGFFVGIRKFANGLADVEFAVDDAIDMAYTFAMGANVNLVHPNRVVLALSGKPQKKESQARLEKLKAAGATIVAANDQSTLYQQLQKQAALAGRDGLFVAFFATHGFNRDGVPYLMTRSSLVDYWDTAISAAKITEIIGRSEATRSLVFFDACRERVDAGARAGTADPRSAAPLIEKMSKVFGQVIFYAAVPDGYAYDDKERKNGVFTAAVLDTLQCTDKRRRYITVRTLANGVETRVLHWLRANRHMLTFNATQLSTEGSSHTMPLELCHSTTLGVTDTFGSVPAGPVAKVELNDTTFQAMNARGQFLWKGIAPGHIHKAAIGPLFSAHEPHVVIISDDEHGATASQLTVYGPQGALIATYHEDDGQLQNVTIGRETGRHNGRIIVAGTSKQIASNLQMRGSVSTLFLFNATKSKALDREWYDAITTPRVENLEVLDFDDNRERDIAVTTSKGKTLYVDFDGRSLRPDRDVQIIPIAK